MSNPLQIEPCALDERCETLRIQVREFLAETLADYPAVSRAKNWADANPEFSRKLGARGWIGMTWPSRFGGRECSTLERYVVLEELLAAGAPVGAHWIADRQSGPLLMRYAAPGVAERIVPGIARGETYFCIGMSEPDSGSDLASIRTRADKTSAGWVINGRKLWTTFGHGAHYMIALVRTDSNAANRHAGMSQFLIDMKTPGISIRPVRNLVGEHDFNEITFDDVEVADDCLIGEPGDGWNQVTAELAFERSGPERYLSNTQLLLEMLQAASATDRREATALGRVVARYATLRQMSLGLAGMLARGENPALAASVVKDLGAVLEQSLPTLAYDLFGERIAHERDTLAQVAGYAQQASVSYSLRGGTREILRGIISRGLGLR
jgi:acyl-CoA dehydrogenase